MANPSVSRSPGPDMRYRPFQSMPLRWRTALHSRSDAAEKASRPPSAKAAAMGSASAASSVEKHETSEGSSREGGSGGQHGALPAAWPSVQATPQTAHAVVPDTLLRVLVAAGYQRVATPPDALSSADGAVWPAVDVGASVTSEGTGQVSVGPSPPVPSTLPPVDGYLPLFLGTLTVSITVVDGCALAYVMVTMRPVFALLGSFLPAIVLTSSCWPTPQPARCCATSVDDAPGQVVVIHRPRGLKRPSRARGGAGGRLVASHRAPRPVVGRAGRVCHGRASDATLMSGCSGPLPRLSPVAVSCQSAQLDDVAAVIAEGIRLS